jgi:hypothetical protein
MMSMQGDGPLGIAFAEGNARSRQNLDRIVRQAVNVGGKSARQRFGQLQRFAADGNGVVADTFKHHVDADGRSHFPQRTGARQVAGDEGVAEAVAFT